MLARRCLEDKRCSNVHDTAHRRYQDSRLGLGDQWWLAYLIVDLNPVLTKLGTPSPENKYPYLNLCAKARVSRRCSKGKFCQETERFV